MIAFDVTSLFTKVPLYQNVAVILRQIWDKGKIEIYIYSKGGSNEEIVALLRKTRTLQLMTIFIFS